MAEKAIKLSTFSWEGVDKRGSKVKGESQATNPTMLRAELRRQGIAAKKVVKKSTLFSSAGKKKKVTTADIAVFSRQLATMLDAGVPLVQAFDIIGRGHENAGVQDLVMKIKTDVEGGASLVEALSKHPYHFDELFCNLVQAGEQAGVLDTLLDKIATYKEKTESIKKKIKKALFYPTAVIVVAFVVTAILLIYVVPQFEDLFSGFGADLPAFTQMVVNLSEFFQSYWWAMLFGAVGVIVAFVQGKRRSQKFAHLLDRIALKLPIVGVILNKAAQARFARTLSTMFAAGVPLVDALQSVSGATGNVVYQEATLKMKDDVSSGQQLQSVMRQSNLFPNMMVQMVAIGEESGALDDMLAKVADFYEEEVDNAIDSLSSLLEPLIMAILGVLVGGLVIAMYLPIFKMGQVV
ncbi:type II secretion system F family protein [Alkalilimnicola sp. S0819]|uniref:type II secretion system F family protein n=1 Tax=Alkalilimnicola sp. S0819 TaxID=2613922 RepID=UPI001261B30B|nr:type II secretion system F family protein [Alkalilimnicola sp. S0819]KAB7623134.1 type II secretion system F family protein [Alkalilimnicola sp. S0819]MPQ16978.1 type II secretion system F family protein [Alkalilimnicola sp. S0819]